MTLFGVKRVLLWIFLAVVLSGSMAPGLLIADDSKDNTPSKAVPIKPDVPTPGLTERERWLLDRVEQLEKRVADLESKGNTTTLPAGDASAVQPASANLATSAVAARDSSITPGPKPASSSSISNDHVALLGPQATEKGKSGAAKTPATEPFAFADFTWLNGNARTKESPMDTKFFTPEIRADIDYIYDFNHPKDNTISGSSEVFRANEVQVTQLGVGGDFHYDNVRARLMTQFGLYSQTTPRNDASPARPMES